MNKLYFILMLIVLVGCNSLVKPEQVFEQKTTKQIKKSVVKISSNSQKEGRQEGTGFVVGVSNDKTYILTVSHVIGSDQNPTVEFFENEKFQAEVLDKESQKKGLALLSVTGLIPYDVMPLYIIKKRNLKSGDTVFTFGFPRGGVRWAYDKLSYTGQKHRDILFSNSSINEGNSGSPVIKEDQVVAIITSITDYAYSTPTEDIRNFLTGSVGGKAILKDMEKWNIGLTH